MSIKRLRIHKRLSILKLDTSEFHGVYFYLNAMVLPVTSLVKLKKCFYAAEVIHIWWHAQYVIHIVRTSNLSQIISVTSITVNPTYSYFTW